MDGDDGVRAGGAAAGGGGRDALADPGHLAADLGGLVADLPELAGGVADLVPAEALAVPVEALPAYALGWMARLLALFGRHAYLLAFAGALAENTVLLGFLLPGGTTVALAGAAGRAAGLPLPALVALAAAGMAGGALLDYALGRAGAARLLLHPRLLGHPRTGRLCRALAARLDSAGPLLCRHGWWLMLLAHAFGAGRSSLAVAAGAARLPLGRFLAIELPAAALWGAAFAGGGYLLADRWQTVELALRQAGGVLALTGLAAGLVWWWGRRRAAGRRPARASRAA